MFKKILSFITLVAVVFGLYTGVKYLIESRQASAPAVNSAAENDNVGASGKAKSNLTELAKANDLTGNADYDNNFASTQYTPKGYIPPKYDPFSNRYNPKPEYKELLDPVKNQPDIPPQADFTIFPQRQGFSDSASGTVGTKFLFNSSGSMDKETSNEKLESRWDFDGDGTPDTYFSTTKSVSHAFEKAGDYNVILEIMDRGGNTAKSTKLVKIVNNTAPTAYFIYKPTAGTMGKIFSFDTSKSYDDQYQKYFLQYRFDWNSDGIWDTKFEPKTNWNHKFSTTGVFKITMEAKDPEGLTDQTYAEVTVVENTPPVASVSVSEQNGIYYFDASGSQDSETPTDRLLYRWDYNYTGPDDIVYDTNFSSAQKVSGKYSIPGNKVIKVEVKDEDGAVTQAFAEVEVL